MKNKLLNLKLVLKRHCSLLLTGVVLLSSLSGVMVFGNTINADAASVFDSQTSNSYSELVTENFKDGSFDTQKWINPYNAAQLSDKGLKLNNPTPAFTSGGPSYLSNILWLNKSFESTDQHVAAEIYFEENPTSWNNNQYVHLWGRASMGEKFAGSDRNEHNKATNGYHLRISSGNYSIDVLKRLNNAEVGIMKLSFNGSSVIDNRPGTYRFELNITGNNPVVINARILEKSGTEWKVVSSNTAYDASTTQIASGTAGVGMYTNGYANGYIENFRYITTDVADGEEETYNYVSKTAVDTTGRLFAQVVTLNPAKKYQLTAYTNTLDNATMERFWIEYLSTDGVRQNGNKHRLSIDVPTVSQLDGTYVASSKVFCINEYVSSTGAAAANISASKWLLGDTSDRTNAIVGFRLDAGTYNNGNSMSRTATFTHFELYEIDSEGKRVGGNLILNPDFKLGLYGWNDNQETTYTNYTTNEIGDSVSGKSLVTCYTCADKKEYESMFKSTVTDLNNTYYKLNTDKKLNITYMGGSVVSGHGASDVETTSWRGITNKWFKENYPNAEINTKNAAVGSTGSHFALYNFDLVQEDTDLLIFGASPNDFYLYNNAINNNVNPEAASTYDYAYRHAESLIIKAYEKNPNMDIVIVLLYDHWRINDNTYLRAYTELAKKYSLPLVDMRVPLKEQAEKDGFAWSSDGLLPYRTAGHEKQLFLGNGDGVHPNDAGYKLYGDYIIGILDELLTVEEAPTSLIDRTPNSAMVSGSIIKDTKVITADQIPLAAGWNHSATAFSTISDKFGDTYTSVRGIVESSTVGATLSYTFTGTDFGIITRVGNNYGKVYVEIDGVPYRQGDNGNFNDGELVFKRINTNNSDHRTQVILWNGEDKKHTVTIKVVEGKIEIGAYYLSGTPDTQGSGGGSGGDDGDGDGDSDQWILSQGTTYKGDVLKVTGSVEDDSYLKNYAFNKAENINQRISIETDINTNNDTAYLDPVLWVRADFDTADDGSTLTGYYAKFSIKQKIEIYKRYKDGDTYKDVLIGTLKQDHSTRKYRYELVAEAVGEQTKLTVTVSKYGNDGKTLYLMSRNTFYDDTASLQDKGYAGASLKVRQEQSLLTSSMSNVEYNTTDSKTASTAYLSKPTEPKSNTTFGQMLALDPAKTYVVSALVSEDNTKLFVEYNSGEVTNAYTRMVVNGGTVNTSDGWRRITAEININGYVTENEADAPYVDGGYTAADGTKLALVMLGFRLNNGKDMAYSELTVYEKDDTLKRNLITNADFKMGLYGFSDNMNMTFISHNLGTVDSTESYNKRVSLVNCDEAEYAKLFKVSGEEKEEEIFDYENYDGEYMLYCSEDSSHDYGKFGQVIELEKGKTYIYSVKYKYIIQKQVAPIALYYTDASMEGANRKTLDWEEVKDEENSVLTYTIEVPSDAFLENNKTKMLIGLTLGEKGGINYFRDFLLYDESDSAKTNLFTNADFKQGLYGWIHATGYIITAEKQKNVYFDDELALKLLPVDDTLFINDTNDKSWNDGDWYSKFGPDDEVEVKDEDSSDIIEDTDISTNNSIPVVDNTDVDTETEEEATNKKQVQQILATRKIRTRGKINVPATIALYGGIVLGVAAVAGGIWFIIAKKRKRNSR